MRLTRPSPGQALGRSRRCIVSALVLAIFSGAFGPLGGCKSEKTAPGRAVPPLAPTLEGGKTKRGEILVNSVTIGWGTPQLNRSVIGTPLSIGGQGYQTGFGICAISRIEISFPAKYKTFTGSCGIDDVFQDRGALGTVVFKVLHGEKVLFESPLMRGRMKAADFSVPVTGLTSLILLVEDGGDGINSDHADWVNLNLK